MAATKAASKRNKANDSGNSAVEEASHEEVLDQPEPDTAPPPAEDETSDLTPDEAEQVVDEAAEAAEEARQSEPVEEVAETPRPAPLFNEPPKQKEPEKKKIGRQPDPDAEIKPLIKVQLQLTDLAMLKGHSQRERMLAVCDYLSSKSPEWWQENGWVYVTCQNMKEHNERQAEWDKGLCCPAWKAEKKK